MKTTFVSKPLLSRPHCLPGVCAVLVASALASGGLAGCNTADGRPGERPLAQQRSSCLLGDAHSCEVLAQAYLCGAEVKKSCELAARYFEEACALGSGEACFRLGQMYELGEGIRRDAAAAVECYGMACVFSDGRGCFETGQVFRRCRGTPEAKELSRRFYRMACVKNDHRGCQALQKHRRVSSRGRRIRRPLRVIPDAVRPGALD